MRGLLRRTSFRAPFHLFILVAVLTLASSCGNESGESSPTGPTGPTTGALRVTISVDGQGAKGVTVSISGTSARSLTTDDSGVASFNGIPAGPYSVRISGFDALQYEFDKTEYAVAVGAGKTATAEFAGTTRFATVSGVVFADVNRNDTLDAGEGGLAGFMVRVMDASSGALVASTESSSGGAFLRSFGRAPIECG